MPKMIGIEKYQKLFQDKLALYISQYVYLYFGVPAALLVLIPLEYFLFKLQSYGCSFCVDIFTK